jgi:hypothetical protein
MDILKTLSGTILPLLKSAGVPKDVLVEAAKVGADAFLDRIEERIEATDTQVDDLTVGKLITVGRALVGIEETVGSGYEDT